jgi:dihydrofolate synthase/folylpolyglutamate synthase
MPIETYDQALAYWHRRINYEQIGMPADLRELKLERMQVLLSLLGDPHLRTRVIHVAGSKGKGSTAMTLSTIFKQAGYRTGLFTSPHLVQVEERILVDNTPITPGELTELMKEIEAVVPAVEARTGSAITFFELITALGFLYFVRRRVEWAVVEVGLGGRFDSTNVCRPELCLITSISYDHTQQLGNSLREIAFEKAGILKQGRPAISGATAPEAEAEILRVAASRGVPLKVLDRDFSYTYRPGWVSNDRIQTPRVQVRTRNRAWPEMELSLLGEHQAANTALAVAAVETLRERGVPLSDAAVLQGVRATRWPARMEVLGRSPFVILDCAHNVASIDALLQTFDESFPPGRRSLVLAVSKDKDIPGMLARLAPRFENVFLTTYRSSMRSASVQDLEQGWLAAGGSKPTLCATPELAWRAAAERLTDLICITGSVFLAGELRPILLQEQLANPASQPGGGL